MMRATAWLLAAMFTASLWAQAPKKYPLRAVEVVGNEAYSDRQILAETGLKIGDEVSPPDFNTALMKLNEAGVFEKLEFRYEPFEGGYKVIFTVVEVSQLYEVRFEGFDAPPEELSKIVADNAPLYVGKAPGDGPMVLRIGHALQAHWNAAGHDSKIIGRLAPIDGERLGMIFQPETRIETISFVTFQGPEAVPAMDLQRMFNPIAMGEPYSESRIQELLHFNVRPLFEAKGRMEVTFCPCEASPDPDTSGLLVQVQVTDGPEYQYGEIQLPEIPGFDAERVKRIFDFSAPERVNMTAVREAAARLDETLARSGFIKASTQVTDSVDKEAHKVNLDIETTAGAQYSFNHLAIKGLDILSEPVIRKRWGLKRGDPFNPEYPIFFLNRIRDEQMFDNLEETRSAVQINEANRTVDVTLTFMGKGAEKSLAPYEAPKNPF